MKASRDEPQFREELEFVRRELDDANAVLAAIRHGEADALLVDTVDGPRVYALKSADEPYRTIVESMSEGAATITADGVVLYCNDAFAALVGRDCSRLAGANLDGIIDAAVVRQLVADPVSRRFECVLTTTDGRRRVCQVSSARHATDEEGIWCLLVTDLTGQALRLRHDAIVEATDDAIVSFDGEARIATWNRAAESLFGYAAAEAVGRTADLLVPPGERDAAFRDARAGRTFRDDAHCVAKDGTRIEVSITASPIRAPDGAVIGVCAILRDVRERKAAEARIAAIRETRQRELEQADRQKNEFLAMLAHELRNPLAPIRTASELLVRMTGRDAPTNAVVDILRRQALQLTRIVDDLLDISRITRGRIELTREPLELASIVAEAVETVEPLLIERGHRLTVVARGGTAHVHGDRVRLVQCLTNLLTNATKYTDPGGRIEVTSAAEGGIATLTVADTGTGISADLLPRVFDLFVQSERTLDRAAGGLGIGLSLAQRLVEMHGGTIRAESGGLGRGSTFTIRLPTIPAPAAAGADESPRVPLPARRILVVDDNADAADALAMLLRLDGQDAEAVHDAHTGVARATRGDLDLVLLDIGLPDVNGYEAAQRIRAATAAACPRLVALTGYGQPGDRARALAAGFDDHVVKPVELMELRRVIADA